MKKCQPRLLTPYLDGELSDDMRREIDQHLQGCASCGTLLEELTDATRQVGSMGRATIPRPALTPALDIFIERAGLTPSHSVMRGTTEVVRAGMAIETLSPGAAVGATGAAEATAKEPEVHGVVGIPDDEYWGQKAAPDHSPPANVEPAVPADIAAQAPTWIEPEPWVPARGPEQLHAPEVTGVAPEAAGVASDDVDDIHADSEALAADGDELEAPGADRDEPENVAESPAIEPELELRDVEARADRRETFEAHPSPPPPEIRPPWMDAPSRDDEDLEAAGRRAVDEAIATNQTDSTSPIGISGGPPETDEPADGSGEAQGADRGWLASLLNRHHEEPSTVASEQWADADTETPAEPVPVATTEKEAAPDERNVAAFRAGMASIADPTFDFGPSPGPGRGDPVDRPAASERSVDEPGPKDATPETADDPGHVRGYREALLGARDEPPPPARGLGSLNTQLQIGLFAALAIVILLTTLLLINQGPHPSPTASTSSHPGAAAHPSPATSPSHSAAPSPAPSATGTGLATAQLTEVVTAGAGGGGWRVAGIRTGSPNPATGITRVVFDLEGAGAQPSAKMGRGTDGAVYLTAAGITISPATLAGFNGRGAITGITQTGTDGLALRLATNGNPGFSIGYLSVPNRLVLDFK